MNNGTSDTTTSKNLPGIIDTILLGSAFTFCCILIVSKIYKLMAGDTFSGDVYVFTGSIWVTLLFFQFKALRKSYVFAGWIIISLIMLCMYLWLQNDSITNITPGKGDIYNCAPMLVIPFIILVYYQLCRQISLQINNTELVMPRRHFTYDADEKRSYNGMDVICALGLWIIPVVITILAKQ